MKQLDVPFLSTLKSSRWEHMFKWVVLVASLVYLCYKLWHFTQYHELWQYWQQATIRQFSWFLLVIGLLPLNWLLEALKWKKLCATVENIDIRTAIKAVLAGISTGFITPNRIGELVGRILYLKPHNRKAGATLSIVNSATQNLIMLLCGVPAAILFFNRYDNGKAGNPTVFLIAMTTSAIVLIVLYFLLPRISQSIQQKRIFSKANSYIHCLSHYNTKELSQLLFISLMRYLVFISQFYALLLFFNVQLDPWQALISIASSYLFVTFTPAIAFSEVAIRSSFAVFFIGAFSPQTLGIALAGISIWAINYFIPLLFGITTIFRKAPSLTN